MANEVVLVLEDNLDLAALVSELLAEASYDVQIVASADELLAAAQQREAHVALVDSSDPVSFDRWWIGPRLTELGVRPIVFSAHSDARRTFQEEPNGFVDVVLKPFDADDLLKAVESARHQ